MYILRNLIIVLGVFVFTNSVNAITEQAVSSPQQVVAMTGNANELVNINTADAVALKKVKGIGKKKSKAIIDYRNKNGAFKSIDDLLKVKCRGINKKWLDKVSKFLTV